MKKLIKACSLLALPVLLLSSCNSSSEKRTESANAILLWSGEYMVDGCGFEVLIDAKKYKPANEDIFVETFKEKNRNKVILEFVRLDSTIDRRCGLSPVSREMEAIKIISVKAK